MGVFCPPLIPFLSLIKSRVRRPGPDSESAQPDSESVSPSLELPWVPSHGSESVSRRVGSFAGACNAFLPPECFSLLAVRCIPLPQGGRATGPSPGAGYRAGAGGTPQYPEVLHLAVWVRLPLLVHPRAHSLLVPPGAEGCEARVQGSGSVPSLCVPPAASPPARLPRHGFRQKPKTMKTSR